MVFYLLFLMKSPFSFVCLTLRFQNESDDLAWLWKGLSFELAEDCLAVEADFKRAYSWPPICDDPIAFLFEKLLNLSVQVPITFLVVDEVRMSSLASATVLDVDYVHDA